MSLPCCCNLSRQGICHSNWHKFWDDKFGSFVFLELKKGWEEKRGSQSRFWFVYTVKSMDLGFMLPITGRYEGFSPNVFLVWLVWAGCIQMTRVLSEVRTASRLLCKLYYHLFIGSQNVGEKWIITYCTYLLTVLDIELCSGHQKSLTRWRITRFQIV